ncbi:MAG: 6-carboxytetrahydropterin synthase [Verrucomicrobia bacterium]|nr:6-carboxytetrahydropterin synthase [Verrucomicrobiota bacterium]
MPYRICKTIEIESGHMLSKHPANCKFPHGHTRKVEVTLVANTLDPQEMVCDYKVLKTVMSTFLDQLDHAMCMNTEDSLFETFKSHYGDRIVEFEGRDPTTEVLAEHLFHLCKDALAAYALKNTKSYTLRTSVTLERIRVWETTSSWAEYYE